MSTSAPADWAQRDERGSRAALTLMCWLSLGLGRTVSRLVLPFIALYFLLAAPTARRASRAYLARALGRPATWIDVLRHFHTFASTVHDRAFLLNDRFDQFEIEIESADEVDRALAAGPGAFLVGAHFGSFEVLRAATRSAAAQGRHHDVTMVMFEDNARRINAALAAMNPRAVSHVIGLGRPDAMLQVQAGTGRRTPGRVPRRSHAGEATDARRAVSRRGGAVSARCVPTRRAAAAACAADAGDLSRRSPLSRTVCTDRGFLLDGGG